jgi:hypothetical protein
VRRDRRQGVPELEAGREGRLAVEKWRPCVRSKITGTSFDACIQIVLLALLLFYPSATVSCANNDKQEVLTNDSIVRMVKAGLSENVILEMIKSNPGNYSLTSNSLIQLKQQGVTDKMLSAMMAKKSGAAAAAPPAGHAQTPQVNQTAAAESADGQWKLRTTTDQMSGQSRLQAIMAANADSNGRHGTFEVTATCTKKILAFTITYHSAFDKDLGFQRTQGASTVNLDPALTLGGTLTVGSTGTVNTPKPQVNLRARIDDGNIQSLVSASDYRNQATVLFTQQTSGDALSRAFQGDFQNMVSSLQGMAIALGAAGTTAEAYHANIIRVELPLANGDAPVLVIRPQDPSFRAYASKCVALDPSAFVNEIKAADGFVYSSKTVLPGRLFEGTAEAFATALPGFLQRAAPTTGFSAETSQKDAAFIAQVVRTCAQITPQMAKSATDEGVLLVGDVNRLPHLGDQYKDCIFGYINVSERLGTYNKETERAVWLYIDPLGPPARLPNGKWQNGQGFLAWVYFFPVKALDHDRVMPANKQPLDWITNFLIARATILPAH